MKNTWSRRSLPFLLVAVILMITGTSCEKCNSNLASGAVMCQIAGWASATFPPRKVDTSLCTHVLLAFGGLCDNGTVCRGYFSEHVHAMGYRGLYSLRSRNTSIGFVVGGWGEGFERFRLISANPELRRNFANSVVETMERYELTAVELAWVNFPENRAPEDRENYVKLVEETSNAIRIRGWQLGVALKVADGRLEETFDVPKLGKYVDWFHVQAYDFHGNWEAKTGIHAPLLTKYPDNANVKFWVERVAQHAGRKCVVMGLSMFGRRWELKDSFSDPGPGAESTGNGGHNGYNEICARNHRKECEFFDVWDRDSMTPWAVCGSDYYSYENPQSIRKKVKVAATLDLAGVSAFTIDNDDFRNYCSGGRYPLLRAAQGIRTPTSLEGETIFVDAATQTGV